MTRGLIRALRFARGWGAAGPRVLEEELEIDRGDRLLPATLFRPGHRKRSLPGWVLLHGITRPGRHHPMLVRFARALARSGAAVLVPEIPEWRELHLAPEQVADTIRAAVLELDEAPVTAKGRTGVIGFSFGAPQALIASTDPSLEGHLAAVVGFGGYCDLDTTVRFLFLGEHQWRGEVLTREPDPYGRWVLGANYLVRARGFEDAEDVAEALLTLARKAGDVRLAAWEGHLDGLKRKLEGGVHPDRRGLFRVFAPPAGENPPVGPVNELAPALAQAMRESTRMAEPGPFLKQVPIPVRLIHGWEDRLIPFSETYLLRSLFPDGSDVRVHMTGLFSHSQTNGVRGHVTALREKILFLRMLTDILGLV
ncbi:dienelactone hydrolase family protein [Gemmatimonadota bacterium]